ncbi:unnamed protein product, partial [Mesorhabditis belari]|uniref:Uncharacterized protein n=1 Tax=Mesorhabditis belari TaxID=2138241 RepID=A0AAF3EAY9_9BILA
MGDRRSVTPILWVSLCILILCDIVQCGSEKELKKKISPNGPSFMKRTNTASSPSSSFSSSSDSSRFSANLPLSRALRYERIPYYFLQF